METVKIYIILICFVFIGGRRHADGIGLDQAEAVISIARKEIGVREKTGNNDGQRVEAYLHCVGLKAGAPYCAAFLSWIFKEAGYSTPRTAWSPALFPASKIVKVVKPAMVFGIYFNSLKRIAHVGLVESVKGDWITCIEANTNIAGNREGEGVFRRIRHKKTIYRFANWLN